MLILYYSWIIYFFVYIEPYCACIKINVEWYLHFYSLLTVVMLPELQRLGFTRNEANVYFTALKLGSSSVQQLANATGLNRITVHSIVEKFARLQIFHSSYEGKRRKITPMDPEYLKNILKQEEEELAQKQQSLASVLPSMREMFRKQQRGMQITTYQGERGYEQMCNDILNAGVKKTLEYASIDALNKVIGPYVLQDYLPRKRKLQIHTQFLYVDTPYAREYIQKEYINHPNASPADVKFIAQDEFAMDSFFVIYADKLAIFTPSTMDGVIMQDQAIVEAMLPFYNFVWQRAGDVLSNYK